MWVRYLVFCKGLEVRLRGGLVKIRQQSCSWEELWAVVANCALYRPRVACYGLWVVVDIWNGLRSPWCSWWLGWLCVDLNEVHVHDGGVKSMHM